MATDEMWKSLSWMSKICQLVYVRQYKVTNRNGLHRLESIPQTKFQKFRAKFTFFYILFSFTVGTIRIFSLVFHKAELHHNIQANTVLTYILLGCFMTLVPCYKFGFESVNRFPDLFYQLGNLGFSIRCKIELFSHCIVE
jgi:hypothetical protein